MVSLQIQDAFPNYRLLDSNCRWLGLAASPQSEHRESTNHKIANGELLVVPRYSPKRFIGDDLFDVAEQLKE